MHKGTSGITWGGPCLRPRSSAVGGGLVGEDLERLVRRVAELELDQEHAGEVSRGGDRAAGPAEGLERSGVAGWAVASPKELEGQDVERRKRRPASG